MIMNWQMLLLATTVWTGGADDTVMLEFTADWCPACRTMDTTVDRLIQNGYPVKRVNVDRNPELVDRFQVVKMPTFLLVQNGKELGRLVGPTSYARLEQMIRRANPPAQIKVPDAALAGKAAQQGTAGELEKRLLQATVRLEVRDAAGSSYGSGTIIDARSRHALVLTCGHLFRDSAGSGEVLVDLFVDSRRRRVRGELICFDAAKHDIALVKIRPGVAVKPIAVAGPTAEFNKGDVVFSTGCDRGDQPSLKRTQINSLNRYHGPENIQIAGLPADGRSGGGLFTAGGELIGVCNAADPIDQEGFYSSLANIHAQLQQAGLSFVLRQPGRARLAVTPVAHQVTTDPGVARFQVIVRGADGEELLLDRPSASILQAITKQAGSQGATIPEGIRKAALAPGIPATNRFANPRQPVTIRGQSNE
jgi:thiol-disulfide isomerase/thioredoxin